MDAGSGGPDGSDLQVVVVELVGHVVEWGGASHGPKPPGTPEVRYPHLDELEVVGRVVDLEGEQVMAALHFQTQFPDPARHHAPKTR